MLEISNLELGIDNIWDYFFFSDYTDDLIALFLFENLFILFFLAIWNNYLYGVYFLLGLRYESG